MDKIKHVGMGEFEVALDQFGLVNLTPERIRDIVQKGFVTSGPGFDRRHMPTSRELDTISDMALHAVNRGQLIDFGYWPNNLIKQTAKRGGQLYVQSALAHPFSSPYIILHSWDDKGAFADDKIMTCAYLVNPFSNSGDGICIDFEAMTFEGMSIQQVPHLGVGDRVLFDAAEAKIKGIPACNVIAFANRFPEFLAIPKFRSMASNDKSDDILQAALANVVDPIITALMILNTKGVPSQTIAVSAKLAKARVKNKKPVIPPYRKVDSSSYVTALLSRQQRGKPAQGGTHASPRPHVRIGHWRHYASGERSFIHDTLVAATEDMRAKFVATRSHYVVKDSPD